MSRACAFAPGWHDRGWRHWGGSRRALRHFRESPQRTALPGAGLEVEGDPVVVLKGGFLAVFGAVGEQCEAKGQPVLDDLAVQVEFGPLAALAVEAVGELAEIVVQRHFHRRVHDPGGTPETKENGVRPAIDLDPFDVETVACAPP